MDVYLRRTKIFPCCREGEGSEGCTNGPHVVNVPTYREMLQMGHKFLKTLPSLETSTELQLIGIDCEMVNLLLILKISY